MTNRAALHFFWALLKILAPDWMKRRRS